MKVSGLGKFALGQAVPNRDHAVCVSLPKIENLIGYEEKKPDTLRALNSGYPRFVQHRLIKELIKVEEEKAGSSQGLIFLFADIKHCQRAVDHISINDREIIDREDYTILKIPKFSNEARMVSSFLQNTGGSISSRRAEDILLKKGYLLNREHISPKKKSRPLCQTNHC